MGSVYCRADPGEACIEQPLIGDPDKLALDGSIRSMARGPVGQDQPTQ
jgi:hypothetical protein